MKVRIYNKKSNVLFLGIQLHEIWRHHAIMRFIQSRREKIACVIHLSLLCWMISIKALTIYFSRQYLNKICYIKTLCFLSLDVCVFFSLLAKVTNTLPAFKVWEDEGEGIGYFNFWTRRRSTNKFLGRWERRQAIGYLNFRMRRKTQTSHTDFLWRGAYPNRPDPFGSSARKFQNQSLHPLVEVCLLPRFVW